MKKLGKRVWARVRRFFWLLFVGMWQGACAYDVRGLDPGGTWVKGLYAVRKPETGDGWVVVKVFYRDEFGA